MYAVIETGGFQISVQEGEKVKVPKLPDHPKEKVSFDKILLVGGERSLIGTPYVRDAKVEAEVLATGKGEKVVVFKKKKRTKYRRNKGYRQEYTEVKIDKILLAE